MRFVHIRRLRHILTGISLAYSACLLVLFYYPFIVLSVGGFCYILGKQSSEIYQVCQTGNMVCFLMTQLQTLDWPRSEERRVGKGCRDGAAQRGRVEEGAGGGQSRLCR